MKIGEMDRSAANAKENAARYTRKLFMWANYSLFGTVIASIATLLFLKLSPTGWGWLLLIVNVLTILSGIAGCISSTESGCHTFHVIMSALTAILQGCASLVLFTRTEICVHYLRSPPTDQDYDGMALVKLDATLSLFIFCLLCIGLALSCILHHFAFVDYYQDLEGKRSRNSAKVQGEPPSDHVVYVQDESEVARLNKAYLPNKGFDDVNL